MNFIRELQATFLIKCLFNGYVQNDVLSKIKTFIVKSKEDYKFNITQTLNNTSFERDFDRIHDHHEIDGSFVININNDLETEHKHLIYNFYQVRYYIKNLQGRIQRH